MIVVRDVGSVEPDAESIVTIGVFDGVHIGHQKIMRLVKDEATKNNCRSVVVTFDRNPEELLDAHKRTPHISTLSQKLALIEKQSIDMIVLLPLSMDILSLSAKEFTENIIHGKLQATEVVVGTDFAFGKGRSGNVDYLKMAGKGLGFGVIAVPPIIMDGMVVSSTNIRKMILSGDIQKANRLLGHPFVLEGTVTHGDEIGRTIGYPTANIKPVELQVVPGRGVYAVLTKVDGEIYTGVCSIGTRPTVDGKCTRVETYILDFNENIYGRTVEIAFFYRLRDEVKFADLDELRLQIQRDVDECRKLIESDANKVSIVW